MNNILIIGAHFDDSELGVGGTAAKLAAEGNNVYKYTLTNNVTKFKHMHINVEYETSVKESKEACRILGIKEITEFEPVDCSQLIYNTELMKKIENLLYQYEIDTTFIHFPHDLNQDHIEASKLCMTATRHCRNVYTYQSNCYILDQPYYPTYFFDISTYINLKIEALMQYGDEHNRFNRLFQNVVERNHIWGYSNKVEYAEGFHILKKLEV